MASKDGFSWTKATGLRSGIPCIGAIQPPSNYQDNNTKFDVVVVGAGYSGLTAARDASLAGMNNRFFPCTQRSTDIFQNRSQSSAFGGS